MTYSLITPSLRRKWKSVQTWFLTTAKKSSEFWTSKKLSWKNWFLIGWQGKLPSTPPKFNTFPGTWYEPFQSSPCIVFFLQSPWWRDKIASNIEKRKQVVNEVEKNFFNLLHNEGVGKTMENLRCRVKIELVTNEKTKEADQSTIDHHHLLISRSSHDIGAVQRQNLSLS